MTRSGWRRVAAEEDGQATVELVALIPLLALVALTVLTLLAAHGAREAADQAAVAAAIAQLQDGDPKTAATAASPAWSRVHVVIVRGQARVEVSPRVPRVIARAVNARRVVVFDPAAGGR